MTVTEEQAIEEYKACIAEGVRGNTRRLIETFFMIQTKELGIVPLKMKPAQQQLWENRSPYDLVLKAAQMGFTTIEQADMFADAICRPGIECLMVAQMDQSVVKLFEITHRFYDALPKEVRPKLLTDNDHVMEIDHSDFAPGATSTIIIGSAASKSFGRGRPVHRALFTEVGFYDEAAVNTMAGIIARMPINLSRVVKESTANGQSGHFFTEWQKAKEAKEKNDPKISAATPHFFPWFMEPGYRLEFDPRFPYSQAIIEVDATEKFLRDQHGVDDDQLRWRRQQIATLGEDFFKQENPMNPDEAFLPIGSAVFKNFAMIDLHALNVRPPVTEKDGMRIWHQPIDGRGYVVSVDQASGEKRDEGQAPLDYQVVSVWDAVTLTQMASFKKREVNHRTLAKITAELSHIYNNGLITPERNLAQFGFFEMLDEERAFNVYMHERAPGSYIKGFPMGDNRAGSGTKSMSIFNLREILSDPGGCVIRSESLIREIRNYRYLPGRGINYMGAAPGGNDDEVMAAAIAFHPKVREQAHDYRPGGTMNQPLVEATQQVRIF